MQVTVGVVVAIRLVVLRISQPPSAAVFSLPRALLSDVALHGVLGAPTTTVGGTSHVNNEVRLLGVVIDALAHSVVHDGPVVLVARRPDLVPSRTGVLFNALLYSATVIDFKEIACRVSWSRQLGYFAVGCAALTASICCLQTRVW